MSAPAAERARAVGMVALAAISWGCWSLFVRPSGLSSWETAPLLFVVMGLTLLPFGSAGDAPLRWDRVTAALLVGCALLDALNVVAYFAALRATSVGVAVLAHYLAPLLVACAAPFVDRGEDGRVAGAPVAALVALAGLALVLEPWHAPAAGLRLGAALGALSAVGYAGNVFVARRLARRIGAVRAVGWHSLVAAVLLAPLASGAALRAAGAGRIAWFALGAALLGAAAGVLFLRGMAVIGATRAAMLAFLEPLVAVLLGWLAWHEALGAPALAGGALILGASAFVTLAPSRAREEATA